MRRTLFTPSGPVEHELSDAEVQIFAGMGDMDAKRELARKEWATADTAAKKLEAIARALGLM